MGEIMNSQKGVKLGVPERVSISCPTYGTRNNYGPRSGAFSAGFWQSAQLKGTIQHQ